MTNRPNLRVDFLVEYSEATLIEEMLRIARQLGKDTLSRRDIDQHGKMSSAVVLKRFGSLRQALQAAGLRPTRFMKATDEELLDVLEELWVSTLEKFGRRPERADLKNLGKRSVSSDTVVRRFGSWKKALVATADRADRESPHESLKSVSVAPIAQSHVPRAAISVRKRFFVLKRDNYKCRLCGNSGVPLEVDHIVPAARGGSDALDNLQTLCVPCNRGKRDSHQ